MSLVRMQIRKNLVAILKGRTDARERVFFNRTKNTWAENLPAINMYFRGEPEIQEYSQAPRQMRRILQLEVEMVADGNSDTEAADKIDCLCEQVESLLSLDDSLGGCADDIVLQSVDDIEGVSEGSKTTMATRLTYRVRYNTFNPREDAQKFEDFLTASGEWNLQPGQDSADRATDTVNVRA